jgi:hypothetical protein
MADFKQIIIGAGTSAYTYLYYAYVGGTHRGGLFNVRFGKILLVGDTDLWGNIGKEDPQHKIGQPAHFLQLPSDPSPDPSKLPPKDGGNYDDFMLAKDYNKSMESLKRVAAHGVRLTTWSGKVNEVSDEGTHFRVKVEVKDRGLVTATADLVVIAGVGPQSTNPLNPTLPALASAPDDKGKPYKRVIDGVEYLHTPQPKVQTVCVYGGSATSSWAVQRASVLGVKNIIWLSRSGFHEANPAGRNNDVILEALKNEWMTVGTIAKVTADPFPTQGTPEEHPPTVKLDFKSVDAEQAKQSALKKAKEGAALWEIYRAAERKALETEGVLKVYDAQTRSFKPIRLAENKVVPVSQLVVCLGAMSLATKVGNDSAGILAGSIADGLEPVWDVDHRFGEDEKSTVVAYTYKQRLWVVGAAVFRAGTDGPKYGNVTQMMPRNGHPPEGIAGVVASIKAVTGVANYVNINLTTADFHELELWADYVYRCMIRERKTTLNLQKGFERELPNRVRRFVADQIVALRRHTTFGVEHLAVDEQGASFEAVETTVRAMLTSRETLENYAPPDLLAKWEPKPK